MTQLMTADDLRARLSRSYLAERDVARGPWPITPSAFGTCLRALRLRLEGVPAEPHTEESLRVFELGHQRGERLATRILDTYSVHDYSCAAELPVWVPVPTDHAELILAKASEVFAPWYRDRKLPLPFAPDPAGGRILVRGYLDGLIVDDVKKRATLFDIKTTSSYGFTKVKKEGSPLPYVYQVMAYREGVIFAGGVDLVVPIIIYEAKDADARRGHVGGELFFDTIKLDPATVAYAARIHQIAGVLEAWAQDSAQPEPEFALSGKSLPWQCNYCAIGPQAGTCYGETVNTGTRKKKRYKLT